MNMFKTLPLPAIIEKNFLCEIICFQDTKMSEISYKYNNIMYADSKKKPKKTLKL